MIVVVRCGRCTGSTLTDENWDGRAVLRQIRHEPGCPNAQTERGGTGAER